MAKKTTPKKKRGKKKASKTVETITHDEASRKNIPTAEFQSVMSKDDQSPIRVAYERRNRDLDPQLVWRGKDDQDWSDLVTHAPPLFIQEKVHPKVLIDDLRRRTQADEKAAEPQLDLFADFNGLPNDDVKTEFYQHDGKWQNRMILGDSLQVMASLAEREGLRGQVQCIYIDPPYGIKFNSNFQWSTTSRDVKDGNVDHITREPEQVKAFRDTWRDGIHSYLTYLRDRLTVARDLLTDSGSIFVQIGDENVHRVRALMDEVFGYENFVSLITFFKSGSQTSSMLPASVDYVVWYGKRAGTTKMRPAWYHKLEGKSAAQVYRHVRLPDGARRNLTKAEISNPALVPEGSRIYRLSGLTSASGSSTTMFAYSVQGRTSKPPRGGWRTNLVGMTRLERADMITPSGSTIAHYKYVEDFPLSPHTNLWTDTGTGSFTDPKVYVVQTGSKVIERCLMMATDPGDLVIDPTCGSGTTAYVAEQWGRRWITIDTSRVALALARSRVMGARYPYYLLADSKDGVQKEADVTRSDLPDDFESRQYHENLRHGFVYERVPHITLKSIANNSEIDVIWERMQPAVEQALADLNAALKDHDTPFTVETGGRAGKQIDFTAKDGKTVKLPSGESAPVNAMLEWEVPRAAEDPWPAAAAKAHTTFMAELAEAPKSATKKMREALATINETLQRDYTRETLPKRAADPWPDDAIAAHEKFWEARIARQKEIDASIAAKAEFEYLYDKPYEDKKKVRVAGPFTVESLSPHRVLGVDENDDLIDPADSKSRTDETVDFGQMILENLKTAGVQQAHKEDKINFTSITPWPGHFIAAVGRYIEGDDGGEIEKRAGIFVGPEFGTVSRQDLVAAAREAGDADFDVLISCAFNYEAHASEFNKLGRIPVLKARMNADLHMADDLKNTGKGNLFVVFGEPDIGVYEGGSQELKKEIAKREAALPKMANQIAELKENAKELKKDKKRDDREKLLRQVNEQIVQLEKDIDKTESFLNYAPTVEAGCMFVEIYGVDVFHPSSGEVRSDGSDGIACWFIDTEYNEESFFVRHAYFLGANDPYKSLKTTLKAEINEDAWATLNSDTSRPFPKPKGGRIAVKVINHLGDEVMKVFRIE